MAIHLPHIAKMTGLEVENEVKTKLDKEVARCACGRQATKGVNMTGIRTAGLSFGEIAERYDRFRPGVPAAAPDWLLRDGGRDSRCGGGEIRGG